VVLQPQQAADTYLVTFYNLSIGPLDFQTDSQDSLDPSLWKKAPLPALPAPQVVEAGDPISIHVFSDPNTGREFVDAMTIAPMPAMPRRYMSDGREAWQRMHSMLRNGNAAPAREASPIFGAAREFSVDDAQMRIQVARVTINGKVEPESGGSRVVSGSLVWFYVPNHGRYVLSLTPRPDLGFVQAGEVAAASLPSLPAMIAPGETPYVLFVLHDPAWAPTARGQSGELLVRLRLSARAHRHRA
jgi:hypothetical protein